MRKLQIIFIILIISIYSSLLITDIYASEETAFESFKTGKDLYEKGDFDQAIEVLKKAIMEFESLKIPSGKINEGLYDSYLYMGLCYVGKGEEKNARELFRKAILINPTAKLDPDLFSPKVITLHTEVQASLRVELRVNSTPPGANVYIDDKLRGVTPLIISDLIAGDHVVKISRKDYQDWVSKISLFAGRSEEIRVTLSANLGSLSIISRPPGARVFINNQFRGVTPLSIDNMAEGEYSLNISREGFSEVTQKALIIAGKKTEIAVELPVNIGSIRVTSVPSGADVFLDGKSAGITPLIIKDISVGEHRVELKKSGFIDSTSRVLVEKDRVNDVNVVLSRTTGSFNIVSIPSGALILVDGVQKGLTPFKIDNIPAGDHQVKLTKDGYQDLETTITVIEKKVGELRVEMKRYTGSFEVKSIPAGAQVFIDGDLKGITPLVIDDISVGQHLLRLIKEGYIEATKTVTVAKEVKDTHEIELIAKDMTPPSIVHQPLSNVTRENPIVFKANVTDNQKVARVSVLLKKPEDTSFSTVRMLNIQGSLFEALMPQGFLSKINTFVYTIEACDNANNCVLSAQKEFPHIVKVSSLEPFTEGYVLDVSREKVTISLGSADGVNKGMVYYVFRTGKELRNPVSGELLQIEENLVGRLKIDTLLTKTSQGVMEESLLAVQVGDRIRTKPSIPVGFRAQSGLVRKIILQWNPNPEPEIKGYYIYRSSTMAGRYERFAELRGRDSTTYEDSKDMKEKQTYYYRVTAFNLLDRESTPSEVISAVTKGGPSPPGGLRAEGGKIREIALSWNIPSDPEVKGYAIFRSLSPDGNFEIINKISSRDTNSYADKGKGSDYLKDGTKYYYKIASINIFDAVGDISETVSATTKPIAPPVTGVNATSGLARKVLVKWDSHPDTDVKGYYVFSGAKPESMVQIGKISNREQNTFEDKGKESDGLKDSTTYFYKIAAYYSYSIFTNIQGNFSNIVSATTKAVPLITTGLKAENNQVKQVTISWNRNQEKDIKEYVVFRSKGATGDFSRIAVVKSEQNSYVDIKLDDGTIYRYRLKAIDADGLESPFSDIVSGSTKPIPSPPKGLTAVGGKGKITLTWSANPEKDIVNYNIYRKTWIGKEKIGNTSETTYEDQNLKPNRTNEYFIAAVDKDGLESERSETVKATTENIP